MAYKLQEEQIRKAVDSTKTMVEAASFLGVQFSTFKRYAEKFGLYKPNPGAKGKSKPKREGQGKFPLEDILAGKYPQYQTYKLKVRLLEEGILTNKCSGCGIKDWNGNSLNMELDHVNGNPHDHRLTNLRMLCPNCHAQTETYRSKKRNV